MPHENDADVYDLLTARAHEAADNRAPDLSITVSRWFLDGTKDGVGVLGIQTAHETDIFCTCPGCIADTLELTVTNLRRDTDLNSEALPDVPQITVPSDMSAAVERVASAAEEDDEQALKAALTALIYIAIVWKNEAGPD